MKIAVIIVRILMGLLFLMSAIVVLFNLAPTPVLEGNQKLFFDGMVATVYMMTTIKLFELVCAIALLSGRFVPLALVVLFPLSLNILLYHAFVAPQGLPIAIPLFIGNLFLAWYYRAAYAPLFKAKA